MRHPQATPATQEQLMLQALGAERTVQRKVRKQLQRVLEELSTQHGPMAILEEGFWLAVMAAIIREPWATCGNLAGAVMAERTCVAIIQELRKSQDKSQPLQEFRHMAQRVLQLVPQEDEHAPTG